MAGIHQILRKTNRIIFNDFKRNLASTSKNTKKPQEGKKFKAVAVSISSKGFLRSTKPYTPPENVTLQVQTICKELNLPADQKHKFTSLEEKFKILDSCYIAFKHCVPNSQIYEMTSIQNIVQFYETPVNTITPYDSMKNLELPENLNIQFDYLRFHPDKDMKFGGQTAYPKSSTIVTGLKYRDKYEGHIAKRSWP